jgi:FK506-binding nuclear protein
VEDDEDSDDESYDLDPDQEELLLGDSDEEDDEISDGESDELDDIDEPRIKELESDDDGEEAPKLVEAVKKGKNNKRKAEAEPEGLDEMITKAEEKQTQTQTKKLKNNKGEAVPAEETKPALKNGTKGDKDKKVQFAKQLEQGPTGSASKEKAAAGKGSVKVVQGVTLDDRKIGTGRTVKNGDKIGVRYIGKFKDGKVFDCKALLLTVSEICP